MFFEKVVFSRFSQIRGFDPLEPRKTGGCRGQNPENREKRQKTTFFQKDAKNQWTFSNTPAGAPENRGPKRVKNTEILLFLKNTVF